MTDNDKYFIPGYFIYAYDKDHGSYIKLYTSTSEYKYKGAISYDGNKDKTEYIFKANEDGSANKVMFFKPKRTYYIGSPHSAYDIIIFTVSKDVFDKVVNNNIKIPAFDSSKEYYLYINKNRELNNLNTVANLLNNLLLYYGSSFHVLDLDIYPIKYLLLHGTVTGKNNMGSLVELGDNTYIFYKNAPHNDEIAGIYLFYDYRDNRIGGKYKLGTEVYVEGRKIDIELYEVPPFVKQVNIEGHDVLVAPVDKKASGYNLVTFKVNGEDFLGLKFSKIDKLIDNHSSYSYIIDPSIPCLYAYIENGQTMCIYPSDKEKLKKGIRFEDFGLYGNRNTTTMVKLLLPHIRGLFQFTENIQEEIHIPGVIMVSEKSTVENGDELLEFADFNMKTNLNIEIDNDINIDNKSIYEIYEYFGGKNGEFNINGEGYRYTCGLILVPHNDKENNPLYNGEIYTIAKENDNDIELKYKVYAVINYDTDFIAYGKEDSNGHIPTLYYHLLKPIPHIGNLIFYNDKLYKANIFYDKILKLEEFKYDGSHYITVNCGTISSLDQVKEKILQYTGAKDVEIVYDYNKPNKIGLKLINS